MKKYISTALVAVFLCTTFTASAATCRAGSAAQTGSEAGYNAAKKANDAWAARESQTSDQLQSCLSGIRNISISLPSLQDIMNKASEKVCGALSDKINSNLPTNIDPWQSWECKENPCKTLKRPCRWRPRQALSPIRQRMNMR